LTASSQVGDCGQCHRVPTARVRFASVVHLLVAWQTHVDDGPYCRDCALALFRRHMSITFVGIWWGPGALAFPVYVLLNYLAWSECRRLPAPQRRASTGWAAGRGGLTPVSAPPVIGFPLDPGPPLRRRWTSLVPVAVLIAFISLIAYMVYQGHLAT
jgi:hypothetical protein